MAATVDQINRIVAVGGEIVRVSVPTMEAAEAFKEIKKQVSVPLVTTFILTTVSHLRLLNTAWLSAYWPG